MDEVIFETKLRDDGCTEIGLQTYEPRPGKGGTDISSQSVASFFPVRSSSHRTMGLLLTGPVKSSMSRRANCTTRRLGLKALRC